MPCLTPVPLAVSGTPCLRVPSSSPSRALGAQQPPREPAQSQRSPPPSIPSPLCTAVQPLLSVGWL